MRRLKTIADEINKVALFGSMETGVQEAQKQRCLENARWHRQKERSHGRAEVLLSWRCAPQLTGYVWSYGERRNI